MKKTNERYNKAVGYANYILEGHTLKETAEEFQVAKDTVHRYLYELNNYGYGEEAKKNIELLRKVVKQLDKNGHRGS